MTQEQAAQIIQQNNQLLAVYGQFMPLFNSFLHDVFPFLAVLAAAGLGGLLAVAATR